MDGTTKFLILILFLSSLLSVHGLKGEIHPEFDLTLEQRVTRHGYPIEAHQLETEDDYLLSVYHIPYGLQQSENKNKNKSIVLIVHGMGGTPHNFVVLGPKKAAPYYFVDRGMDVWLFCSRGLPGSFKKNHKKLDWDKDPEYWLHSLHEIGKYDLSATIDYVLNYTGQKKLTLIGHSAGGNEFYCMFSEKPEYNEKVKLAINWGSSPIIRHMDYPLMRLGALMADIVKAIVKYTRMAELLAFVHSFKSTLKVMCADPGWQKICTMSTWVVGSHKSFLQRPNDVQLIVSNIPRISSMQIIHFMDNINNGTFRKYDHGPKENMRRYGQKHPPHYNLSATIVPCAFYVGQSDGEIGKRDVYESVKQIPNTVLVYIIPYSKFTHLDFIFGLNATEMVYEPTYRFMKDVDNGIIPPRVKVPDNYLE